MSLLARAVPTRAVKGVDQAALGSGYGGSSYIPHELGTWSRLGVDATTAYNIITVYQCVRVLAETFASLPLMVYQRQGDGKRRADDHPLYDVLHRQPNPDMTSFVWRELLLSHLATWGNGFNEKVRDRGGRLQLWPIRPDRVEPFYYSDDQARASKYDKSPGDKGYWYLKPSGGRAEFDPDRVFHVQGLSSNGLVGYSPISLMHTTIRLFKTAERFGTSFFDNDARPATVLSHPKNLSTPAIERLRAQMDGLRGADNAGRTIVVEEGLTVNEVGIHPEDAQFMQTRLFQKREIAAAYRIPPHKVGDLERATFSNIEQQSIEFIQDTMLPWFVRFEQQANTQLVDPSEQDEVFVEFLVDGYLRGDAKARAEAFAIRWQHGTLSADEWRSKENENPIEDGSGDVYYVPVNYQPATVAQTPAAPPELAPGADVTEGDGTPTLALVSSRSLAQFDCPSCGKMINRLAAPGSIGYCRGCRTERTMSTPALVASG